MEALQSQTSSQKTLVFSIATNGYRQFYSRLIRTHQAYADRNGYRYACVDLPDMLTASDSAWMKLPLILEALKHDYDWVLFLDADVQVKPTAPDFRQVAVPGKEIYMANGFSGRFNSGVIMVHNSEQSRAFFKSLMGNLDTKISSEDEAPYENGLVIHMAKGKSFVQVIGREWNNNTDPALKDHFRHYSAGPLKKFTPAGPLQKYSGKIVARFRPKLFGGRDLRKLSSPLADRLELLRKLAIERYPQAWPLE